MAESSPLLQINSISKRFSAVQALDDVSLNLDAGEVVGLVGENGAGKSTLMRILAGIIPADQGSILVDSQPWYQTGVRQAMQLGISLIHQELNLAENLSVAENIFLGRQPHRGPKWLPVTNRRNMDELAVAVMDQVNLRISPRVLVSSLSIAQRQLVEIAKALSTNARILILDEPTSSLSMNEAGRLMALITRLRDEGVAVLYVSHHLHEIVRLANRVVVLRDGQHVGTLNKEDISAKKMISLMVGRNVEQFYHASGHSNSTATAALEVRDYQQSRASQVINFKIQPGEIVGFAGLVGAGRTQLAHGLLGIERRWKGKVLVDGQEVHVNNPVSAIKAGLALVPEDRQRHGLLLSKSLLFNICLTVLGKLATSGWRKRKAEAGLAASMIRDLDIRTADSEQHVQTLSGGNQQKVVLAKWLATKPKVLVLDEPTRGIDIGAKSEIYRLITTLAAEGVAVMMISSEMEEIVGISDRVIVMRDGMIAGELDRAEIHEKTVLALALGATQSQNEDPS